MAAWVPKDYTMYLAQARKYFKESVKEKAGVSKPFHKGRVCCRKFLISKLQVVSLAWNSSGTKLASGSEDKTAGFYSVRGGKAVCSLPLCFSPR